MSQQVDHAWIKTDNALRVGTRIHGSGQQTIQFPEIAPKKSMRSGCEDDFYNDHNPYGVKECWAFKTAKVVNKVGHSSIHVSGGPDTIMEKTLSRWHGICK